ncbi:hypothetical protein [Xanthobacter sediminis]
MSENSSLSTLLAQVSDSAAHPRISEVFEDDKLHARALLRLVYDEKRYRQQNDFYERCYRDAYEPASLDNRRFINFGPGNFRHRYWTTADKIYEANGGKLWSESRGKSFREEIDISWDLYKREPVAIEDGSYEIAYASHVVEHAFDGDDAFFFSDVCRILRPGGVFRVTAPNIDLGLRAARRNDYSYYGYGQYLRGGRFLEQVLGTPEQRLPIEYFVVEQCSLLVRPENGFQLSPIECRAFLWQNDDVYHTLSRASELSDRSLNEKLAAHVNWFNLDKITRMLKAAGFSEVVPSAYGQSVAPVLRDVRHFDNTSPAMSFYVDAIK